MRSYFMRSGLKECSCNLSIEVAHSWPVCSASSKDEHSSGEEKNVDESLAQLRRIQDGALQCYDVSTI